MKCPNCGKEAIFVNGKYVCLDCGIEITPEQQAFQNQANDQAPEPVIPEIEVTPEDVAPKMPEADSITPPSDQTSEMPQATTEPAADKPVQQYYENALSEDEPSVEAGATKPGVYDFDTPETPAPSELSDAPVETTDNVNSSLSEPSMMIMPEQPTAPMPTTEPASPVTNTGTPDYFAPNSFDINATQPATEASPAIEEIPVAETPVASVEPMTPLEPTQSEIPATAPVTEVPPITMPDEIQSPIAPAPEVKTLDDMLGSAPVSTPEVSSPVSAYGPTNIDTVTTAEPTPDNINTESAMPSVESVFGTTAEDNKPNTSQPTAQDFGVAPPPPPQKKKIPLLMIIGGAAIFVLLIGGLLAVMLLSGNRKATLPVDLNDTERDALSSQVSSSMQEPQGITVAYSYGADYSGLIVKDEAEDKATLEKSFGTPFALSGAWYSDNDGDISVDSKTGDINDKRTYIASELSTFVYNAKTKKNKEEAGLNLVGVPTLFDAEEKAIHLNSNNITLVKLLAEEQLEGVATKKYQIIPDEDFVKENLNVLGAVFSEAQYQSINYDNLIIYSWISNDQKRIEKISISGEILLETTTFSGKVLLTGEAVYDYIEVSIENPNAPPPEATDTGNPVSQTPATTNKEEGETSSIDNKTEIPTADREPVIEAKG
jgi:hypothetical protein